MKFIFRVFLSIYIISICNISYADQTRDVINKATDKLTTFITNTISGEGLTEFSIEFPDNEDVEIQYLNFKELKTDEFGNTFSQLSFNTQEINDDTRYIINYGFGKRFLDNDKSMMTGMNLFFDYDLEGHARTSLGLEAKASMLDFTANYYLGLTGTEAINGTNEKVLDGYELNLASQVPFMPWATVNYQNYDFKKDKAAENTAGNIVSLEMRLTPNIQFETSRNFISVSGIEDEDSYKIMYYNPPRNETSMQDGIVASNIFEKENMEDKLIESVRRRNNMTIEVQGSVILTKQ
ncbi:inverse autotransporter beta domain-containing protein [Candidatus Pelagibacter sp.]|nr:inverse autotransporter beta domain-containing protein [Candidatus Pelagibacter sp.]